MADPLSQAVHLFYSTESRRPTNPVTVITSKDWYDTLVTDCKAIITEAVFTSRWALVEGYHALGERIATDENYKKAAKGNLSSFQGLGKNIGISQSSIYYAIQFYEKYPDLQTIPEGKNISWNKIVTKYLPTTKEKTPVLPERNFYYFALRLINEIPLA